MKPLPSNDFYLFGHLSPANAQYMHLDIEGNNTKYWMKYFKWPLKIAAVI